MNINKTITEIELALAKYFDFRVNIIVPNVFWGFLDHEADLIVMTKSGYLTEVEIKRSLSDLKADFKKKHDHSDNNIFINPKGNRLNYFYYCVPEKIFDECVKLVCENERIISGIITYSENLEINNKPFFYKGSKIQGRCLNGRKLFIEEQFQIARLGCMRIWSLKEKIIKIQKL